MMRLNTYSRHLCFLLGAALLSAASLSYAANGKSLFEEIGQGAKAQAKVEKAWQHFFYGGSEERVYYPVGEDMAYIKDVNSNDVRTEGMSYGMMIAAQLDKKAEFDRLWKWAKTYMQQSSGVYAGYFSWHNRVDGSVIESNPAPDGEEYFVQALYTASGRWGNGEGMFNYRAEADAILKAMRHQSDDDNGRNMFDKVANQVVFTPIVSGSEGTAPGFGNNFTDPSYHLPAFYSLWGAWTSNKKDKKAWLDAADVSRKLLVNSAHAKTGLYPNQSNFDGSPYLLNSGKDWAGERFSFDAFRTVMNLTVDSVWNGADKANQAAIATRQHAFFVDKGIDNYVAVYELTGEPQVTYRSTGLIAMNAVGAEISTHPDRLKFVQRLWDAQMPSGKYRYYDGMLYLFAVLIASDNYKIYPPK